MKASALEAEAALLIRQAGLPEPTRQYRFGVNVGRKWTADFCWVSQGVILEIDGGMHRGRHVSASGREDDMVRDAYCALNGWRLLRVSPTLLRSGYAAKWVKYALAGDGLFWPLPSLYPLGSALRPREAARRRVKARAKRLVGRAQRGV